MNDFKLKIYNSIKYCCFTPNDIKIHLKWFNIIQHCEILTSLPEHETLNIKFGKTEFPNNISRFLWYYENDSNIFFIAELYENIFCFFDVFAEYHNLYYQPKIYLANTLEYLIEFSIPLSYFNYIKNGSIFPKPKPPINYNTFNNLNIDPINSSTHPIIFPNIVSSSSSSSSSSTTHSRIVSFVNDEDSDIESDFYN